MKKFAAVLAVAGLASVAGAQVVNGGFETGDLTGWTQAGNNGFTGVSGTIVHSGTFSYQMGPVGSTGTISQTLALSAGDQVSVDFWMFHFGGEVFNVVFDGQTLLAAGGSADNDWTEFTYNVTVTNNNPVLTFEYQNNPSYWFLDDVSVTRVPAPGAAGLLGLGGLVAMRRRR